MSYAVCTACGKHVRWRNCRGARLADVACPACGADLKAFREAASKPLGRIVVCVLCGRRRRMLGRNVREVEGCEKYTAHGGHPSLDPQTAEVIAQAGDMVCWSHSQSYPHVWPLAEHFRKMREVRP